LIFLYLEDIINTRLLKEEDRNNEKQ
jgi:hypothetical protein